MSASLALNGRIVPLDARPDRTLLDWLRVDKHMTGTKEGCAEGDCGACTVLVRGSDGRLLPANACILLTGQVIGRDVVTIEGLSENGPQPLQTLMAENGSSQCGFCTPGIVMALAALGQRSEEPDIDDLHDALAGNLCRCTGYRPIVDAALQAPACVLPEASGEADAPEICESGGSIVHLPRTLADLLRLRAEHPGAVMIGGGTDLNLRVAQGGERFDAMISTARVREMTGVEVEEKAFVIGGAASLEQVLAAVEEDYPSFATLLRRFGSSQIRSQATIGGNLCTASPIGDSGPALIALDAVVTIASAERGEREVAAEDFFLDYRKPDLAPDEVLVSVRVARNEPNRHFRVYKLAKRYDQDISTVCCAIDASLEDERVSRARIAYGGMAATPKRCEAAEAAFEGKPLDIAAAREAARAVGAAFSPLDDLRGSGAYRLRAAGALLERFAREIGRSETVEVMAL